MWGCSPRSSESRAWRMPPDQSSLRVDFAPLTHDRFSRSHYFFVEIVLSHTYAVCSTRYLWVSASTTGCCSTRLVDFLCRLHLGG